ncbi:MAG: adenylate/guanylate cyclase domain-containing protein [Candidatus Limnocylindrales bacterium]
MVTVLFADVVGSTAIGEDLDPEDLSQLLTRYYETARDVVEAYGGTVEKFIGDAVMAIFGAPQAHDDDAHRAIAAGLELRQRVRDDPRLGERLPIRIGINTGEVAISGAEPGQQALVAGDAVNVAARLQQQAEPWSVLVAERTAHAALAGFNFGPPTTIEPRGRTMTVAAREVFGERAVTRPATPFVGRDSDLDQLKLLSRRAFAEGRPWLVTIVAPPGTGKTRLLNEYLAVVSTGPQAPRIVVARCLPYGQQLAYQPLRAVVDGIVGLNGDEAADEVRSAVHGWLSDAGVTHAERTAQLLATTLGLASMAVHAEQNELFGAWRSFLETAARQQPLVLAIEDLHWASDSLLELIDFAMQPHAKVPALLIATTRPDLFDRRALWSTGRHSQMSIELAPLTADAVGRIVESLLPGAAPEAVASVVARADGNPFFALEIARSVSEGAAGRGLPDTVQATIQTRLDQLPPTDRTVMEAVAVFDRSFDVDRVAALTGLPAAKISESIERLVERGLLTVRDGDEITTTHVLIRDVVYAGLPRAQRSVLHRAVADWLIAASPTREQAPAELIAVHYREAATLAAKLERPPSELAGVREQAVEWLMRAAERALAAAASTEAVDRLRAALEIAAPDEQAAIHERIGDADLNAQTSLEAYRQALGLTQTSPNVNESLRLAGKLLLLVTRSWGGVADGPSRSEMDDLLRVGASLEPAATDEIAVARFLIGRAFVPFWSGDPITGEERRLARDAAQRGLTIAESHADSNLRSAALDALGSLADTWRDALALARQRLAFADQLELAERIDAHSTAAWAACVTGELIEAERITAAGLALVEPGQVPSYALHLAAWRINALRMLGRWDELDALGQKAIEFWEATDRSAAGYATRGFADLLEVARARRDQSAIARCTGVLQAIYRQFSGDPGTRRNEVLLTPSRDALSAYLADPAAIREHIRVYGQIDGYERVANRFFDDGGRVDADQWQQLAEASEQSGCLIMAVQALRGVGLARSSADQLERALELARAASAKPLSARLIVELGQMRGDASLEREGIAILRDVGDFEYLGRGRLNA